MFHAIDPFDFDRLTIRIDADIDTEHLVVRALNVFKVGEIGFDDVNITSALMKEERSALNDLVIEDYRETTAGDDGQPDIFELSKQAKEQERERGAS